MKRTLLILFALVAMLPLRAEGTPFGRGVFHYAQFGQSLYADMHPNFVRMDIPCGTNHITFDWGNTGERYRWTTQGMFGISLPLWTGNLVDSTYALSVTLCMSANLWMDFFQWTTSPIVDTDYRIGLPSATFLHRLNRGFARNYSVSWSPFKHESTHLGDELEVQHIERGYALKRVNVSYNYTEFVFTLNEPEDRFAQTHTFRLGLMLLWHGGWYNIDSWDGDESLADPRGTRHVPYAKRHPWELYLQYQYQSPTSKHGFQGIASAEIRNRECYGYDLTVLKTDDPKRRQDERRVFTYNVFVGARYNTPAYSGPFSRVAFGIRAYHGNCPFGEFRSIDNYSQIGACLMFQ